MSSEERKLEVFTEYMSQFAAHRGADMRWVMEASSHGRIFSVAWDAATKAEREACAKVCEQAGIDGCGTLAAAAMIRARGEK